MPTADRRLPASGFFPWGRMGGGMAASAVSLLVLRVGQSQESFAFAGVAAAAGLVLTLWAYAAVQLSGRATAKDRIKGHFFAAFTLGIPVANLALNRDSWSIYFLVVELAVLIGTIVFAAAVVFVIGRFVLEPRQIAPNRLRGYTLLVFVVAALVLWLPIRWPILALYHTGTFGGGAHYSLSEGMSANSALRAMPQWLVRWTANRSAGQPSSSLRQALYARLHPVPELWEHLDPSILSELCLEQSPRVATQRWLGIQLLARRDTALAKRTALEIAKRLSTDPYAIWVLSAVPDLLLEDCTPEIFLALAKYSNLPDRCNLMHNAYRRGRGDLLLSAAAEFRSELSVCFPKMPPSERYFTRDDLAALVLEHRDATVRAGLFDVWPEADISYDPQWQNVPPTTRKLFCRALNDPDISVRAAAVRRLIACVLNQDTLPVKLDDLKDDASIRRAAEALLPALQELKPKP